MYNIVERKYQEIEERHGKEEDEPEQPEVRVKKSHLDQKFSFSLSFFFSLSS